MGMIGFGLEKKNQYMDLEALQTITSHFLDEIRKAEKGEISSLQFITHTLASHPLVSNDEVFQILVIGGSIFKKALARNHQGQLIILKSEEKWQPAFPTEGSLMEFIREELEPTVRVVAINFAYPLTPLFEKDRLDGILIQGTKENTFAGLAGKKLCHSVEEYVYMATQQKIIAACANDTICLLLSGLTQKPAPYIAAGIIGTGMNFALFQNEKTAINLEAANFNKFTPSEQGKIVDTQSVHSGSALFEKEIAGAYLFRHFNLLAKEQGLSLTLTSTEELDRVSKQAGPEGELAQNILISSAQRVGCAIAAITLYKNAAMTFVMEGSLYWKGHQYKETVAKTVTELIPQFPVFYINLADSYFFGAAKLVS